MQSSRGERGSRGFEFFFSWIFPYIFVAVGLGVGYFGVRGLVRAEASEDWPTAQGRVVASSLETHTSRDDGGTTYHAEVLYEFTVDGVVYNGNKVTYGSYGSSNPSHARRILNRYPKGVDVTVHYQPGDPETCVLEPGRSPATWFLPVFGAIFLGAGMLMAVFIPRLFRRKH